MNRREFLKKCAGVTGGFVLSNCAVARGEFVLSNPALQARIGAKPNIIVIIADDLGYADIGCYNKNTDIPTPNIDSIADKGVLFTNGYVSASLCSPMRAGLVTGRYQQRFGYYDNSGSSPGLPLTEVTIADVLKSAGYVTGMVGKWHLGFTSDRRPMERGFDEFIGLIGGMHDYYEAQDPYWGEWLRQGNDNEQYDLQEYLTDAFTHEAISFVEQHRNEPFFLYLTYNAAHTPMQAPKRYENTFDYISDPTRRIYAGMLTAMDDGVGELMAKLQELGLEEDTLVFFINDNGGASNNGSINTPLRSLKGTMYEGGNRVAYMIQWPRRLQGGTTYDHPVTSLDVLATTAAVAKAKVPDDRVMDGVNLIPYLTDRNTGAPHEKLFWWMGSADYAVRKGKWKLTHENGNSELYDLDADVSETQNLASSQPAKLSELEADYTAWQSSL